MKTTAKMLLLAGSFIFARDALAITEQCEGCTVEQMDQIAESKLFHIQQYGPLYIVNLRGNLVRKYEFRSNVTEETNPEFDPIHYWVEPVSVEPYIVQGINDVHVLVRQAPEVLVVNPGRTDLPNDAHEALLRSDLSGNLDRYAKEMTNQSLYDAIADRLGIIPQNPFFNPEGLRAPIKVYFQDGSSLILSYDKTTRQYKPVPGSHRDSKGHVIPLRREDVSPSEFRFDTEDPNERDDFNDMVERLNRLGVPIVNVSHGSTGARYAISCSGDVCTIWVVY